MFILAHTHKHTHTHTYTNTHIHTQTHTLTHTHTHTHTHMYLLFCGCPGIRPITPVHTCEFVMAHSICMFTHIHIFIPTHTHTHRHRHTHSLTYSHTQIPAVLKVPRYAPNTPYLSHTQTNTCCFVGAQVCAESRQSAHRIFNSDLHSCGYAPFLTHSPAPTASGQREEFVDGDFVRKKSTATQQCALT